MQVPRPSGDLEGAFNLPRPSSERVARESDAAGAETMPLAENLDYTLQVRRVVMADSFLRGMCYIMYN